MGQQSHGEAAPRPVNITLRSKKVSKQKGVRSKKAKRCQGQIPTRLSVISGHAQGKRTIVPDVVYEDDTAMARPRHFDLPSIPQHVIQRGNNGLPCFLDDGDRERYLQCLGPKNVPEKCP